MLNFRGAYPLILWESLGTFYLTMGSKKDFMELKIWVFLFRFAFVACHKANSRLKPEHCENHLNPDVHLLKITKQIKTKSMFFSNQISTSSSAFLPLFCLTMISFQTPVNESGGKNSESFKTRDVPIGEAS